MHAVSPDADVRRTDSEVQMRGELSVAVAGLYGLFRRVACHGYLITTVRDVHSCLRN